MGLSNRKKALLAASIAGMMTVASTAIATNAQAAMDSEGVPCYGINACKGTGDCGGKGSSCSGTNACKGQGWIKLPADTCTKIQGGKLTA